jgi:hypothetical protein
MKNKSTVEDSSNIQELSSRFGSVCWLNMIASGNVATSATGATSDKDEATAGITAEGGINLPSAAGAAAASSTSSNGSTASNPNNCCTRWLQKLVTVFKWVFNDFRMRHLVWIKFIFFFQSASMTVLYPYLNLHMKHLGLNVQEVAVINAVIPILFIFTPPLGTIHILRKHLYSTKLNLTIYLLFHKNCAFSSKQKSFSFHIAV